MHYRAPWSTSVKVITLGVIVLLAGIGTMVPNAIGAAIWLMIPLFAAFGPQGYSIAEGELRVHFLGRSKTISLDGLVDVRAEPMVMLGSLRLFGNGGVFGFTGLFRNTNLGTYRAWVTDPALAVVLDFGDRTLVVSPEHPNLFTEELREAAGLLEPAAV